MTCDKNCGNSRIQLSRVKENFFASYHGLQLEEKLDLKVQINEINGFSEAEHIRFKSAIKKLEHVLNSKKFKERMLALPLVQTEGMSNQKIYDYIMSGADKFRDTSDGTLDIHITMYYKNNRTVGYTYPDTIRTWVNRKFFSQFEESEIAGNVFHEYLHNLGFGHLSAKDHNSVPYALGYLVRDMIRENEGLQQPPETKPEPQKRWVCSRSWRTLWLKKVCYWAD